MNFLRFKFNDSILSRFQNSDFVRNAGFFRAFQKFSNLPIISKLRGSFLLWIAGFLTAGFLISTSLDIWTYSCLQEKAPAQVYKWKIREKSSSQFALKASYAFDYQGKTYLGKTRFAKPYHLNRLSAERQVNILKQKNWTVWVQPGHPEHSTLERLFPLKKCIYSLMVLGIYLYFAYLRLSLKKSLI